MRHIKGCATARTVPTSTAWIEMSLGADQVASLMSDARNDRIRCDFSKEEEGWEVTEAGP